MDRDTKDILETVNFIKERMVIKDDLEKFATRDEVRDIVREELEPIHGRLSNIEAELRDIRGRLDLLEEQIGSIKGYAKEIDELRGRVHDIERHLGLNKRIAA